MRALLDNPMIRDNWYLILIAVIAIGIGVVGVLGEEEEASTGGGPETGSGGGGGGVSVTKPTLPESRVRLTPEEKTRETIASHMATYERDPDHKDGPTYLFASGNLHRQRLGEIDKAIEAYEAIIARHPDYEYMRNVLRQLMSCYEQLEDTDRAESVYRLMLKHFPEDSQEYLYANTKLGY